jgi:hypothetical protein
MGYALLIAACRACGQRFGCNPNKVPSIRVNNQGPREPICEECAELWNELHPEQARPIPEDAYAPVDECELG